MTLAAGTKLGPYEILSPIGAGGMGEVYRARDERLKREVAVKVLPASLSADADRLRRFEQEAQAAGTLNHPNVTAVYDVGTHEGFPYVVSELLEGETLRSRLSGGPLPVRKASDYALQIAQGLAAAHEKGIVHRDLKPENVFVTRDGRIKILDFGLAKLVHADDDRAAATSLPTATPGTEPGVVLGTLGYMSPEQVRGKPADVRSDIFSFGAILYEMLSGRRAFHGDSAADTMSAILREEPPDLSLTNQSIPPGLERIVRHCLEKNPEERFHSAHDLAFDLQALSGASAPAMRTAPQGTRIPRLGRAAAVVAIALVIAAVAFLIGRRSGERPLPGFHRLTFRRGSILGARFAPDAQNFVYSASWEGKPMATYAARRGSPDSTAVPMPQTAGLLAVSSSGELALQLSPRVVRAFTTSGTLARVPLSGGAPRELLENVHWADWSPDGKTLAIVRDAAGKNRLEFPAGRMLYETAGWISHPRISPDGRLVAFVDHPIHGDDGGFVTVVDAARKARRLAGPFDTAFGLAWAPNGSEIWFTAAPSGNSRALRAVNLSGKERLLARGPGILTLYDTAAGRALVSSDDTRLGILGVAAGETRERDLSWLDWSLIRDVSADGRTLLFDETGEGGGANYGVYLRGMDGSPAVRLGDGSAMSLSPDGKWALALTAHQLVLLPTGAGEPRPIPGAGIEHHFARFVDERRVVFSGNEPGRAVRFYLQEIGGGQPRAISPEGIEPSVMTVSPDGSWVAAIGLDHRMLLYSTRGEPARAVPGTLPDDRPQAFLDGGRTLCVRRGEVPLRVFRIDITTGRSELWKELTPGDAAGLVGLYGPRISADGRAYAYTYARQLSTLYLIDGLK